MLFLNKKKVRKSNIFVMQAFIVIAVLVVVFVVGECILWVVSYCARDMIERVSMLRQSY